VQGVTLAIMACFDLMASWFGIEKESRSRGLRRVFSWGKQSTHRQTGGEQQAAEAGPAQRTAEHRGVVSSRQREESGQGLHT